MKRTTLPKSNSRKIKKKVATLQLEHKDIIGHDAEPNVCQIVIRNDRKVVWINWNEVCILRICRIKDFQLRIQGHSAEQILKLFKK